ncbi:MAG: S8 family serine peptidase, partial [Burkholderiales bacterium]
MRHTRFTFALAAASALALAACAPDNTGPGDDAARVTASANASSTNSYLILGKGNTLPSNLASKISAAGGTLTRTVGAIGVASATSSNPSFPANAAAISGIEAVALDAPVQWVDPNERVVDAGDVGNQTHGNDETFFNLQWAPKAISAPQAQDAGYVGAGVRVAVLDGGLNNLHIDLNGSVDVARSTSFVTGFAFNQDVGIFSHATHVAGIVAAQDDGVGTIGVAPGATIIGVKVLHGGSGSFGAVIAGIVYAATPISQGGAGANIINMSLGAGLFLQGVGAAQLTSALSRATTYAYQQGTTVIASAGNAAVDLDHTANVVFVPAQSANVIAVSATGPVGFAVGYPFGATNFSRPASYTNFGQSAIDFGAPGGDFVLPGTASCSIPRIPTGFVVAPCWVFDLVISPAGINFAGANQSYSFAAGTSMAAPHVAGVAALIIGKNGGSMPPAEVEAA